MATYAEIKTRVEQLRDKLNLYNGVNSTTLETVGNIKLFVTQDLEHIPYYEPNPGETFKWIWLWEADKAEWTPCWVTSLPPADSNGTIEGVLVLTWSNFD